MGTIDPYGPWLTHWPRKELASTGLAGGVGSTVVVPFHHVGGSCPPNGAVNG